MSVIKYLVIAFILLKLIEQALVSYIKRMDRKVKAYIKRERQKYPL